MNDYDGYVLYFLLFIIVFFLYEILKEVRHFNVQIQNIYRQVEYMNNNGYFIKDFHLTKVYNWYGMSLIITFSNEITTNIISIDRIVHK
jgi:hypothetical protein